MKTEIYRYNALFWSMLLCILLTGKSVSAQKNGTSAPGTKTTTDTTDTSHMEKSGSADSTLETPLPHPPSDSLGTADNEETDTTQANEPDTTLTENDSDSGKPSIPTDITRIDSGISSDDAITDTLTSDTADTTIEGWYFNVGLGVTIGSSPLFSTWEDGLPRTFGALGFGQDYYGPTKDSTGKIIGNTPADTSSLVYSIEEEPSVYNMSFPLSIGVSRISPDNQLEFSLSAQYLRKNFILALYPEADSLKRGVDLQQQLFHYSLFVDFNYARTIPVEYFTIDGVNRSSFLLGLSICPLSSAVLSSDMDQQTDHEKFTTFTNEVAPHLNEITAYGLGLSWRVGITTLQRMTSVGLLRITALYTGYWFDRFRYNGNSLREKDLHLVDRANSDRSVSFTSNRIGLQVSLMWLLHKN